MKKMHEASIWTAVQTDDENGGLLLRTLKKNIIVPVFVAQLEMETVLTGLEGKKTPRPMPHDLFLKLLDTQNLALDHIEINEFKESIYYAKLAITNTQNLGSRTIYLDSRPSDALALATRSKCRIFVSSDIVDIVGIPSDYFLEALQDSKKITPFGEKNSFLETKYRRLTEELTKAVEKEEYEKAAKIRDMINAIDKPV